MTTSHPASAARQAQEALGLRLRQLRRDTGLTARQLAELTEQHYTRVSKIENGVQSPSSDDIRRWCTACDAQDQVPDLLATLNSLRSAYLEFRRQSRGGLKRVLGPHTSDRYVSTTLFRIYEHNVIPGLFQTADYCAAMLSFWIDFLQTTNDLSEAVAARMERQRVLYQRGKRFAVVLEEQALRTWFGDAQTQAGQLDRLITVMSLPNVSVGIVPLMNERAAVASTGFWIFDDGPVAMETPTASIEVHRPQEIDLYARMFHQLEQTARYGKHARAIVTTVLDEISSRE